ncbi:hypothetical protein [Bradyrhizobium sp. USDA 4520]
MEIGLKTFLPKLAQRLQTTPGSLYEYQRKLVALGVLKQRKGKGPGTGVRLTADNLAALLLAQLFTENPSLVDERVKWLCKSTPGSECALTGAKSLRGAIAAILSMSGPDRRPLHQIVLYRDQLETTIRFQTPDGIANTFFDAGKNQAEWYPIMTTRALLSAAMANIATDFQAAITEA